MTSKNPDHGDSSADSAASPAAPSDDRSGQRPESGHTLWSRRDALTRSGWGMVIGVLGVFSAAFVRLLFPRVQYRLPSTVTLGPPQDFAVGVVNTRWKKSHNIIVVRTQEGFYALRSVCTHLGCIPNWKPAENKFKCPCHGSGFHPDGVNFEGPAPRPLERFKLFYNADDELVVDTAVRMRQDRGEWEREGAFLPYPKETRSGRT